jgi:hypothetical protein
MLRKVEPQRRDRGKRGDMRDVRRQLAELQSQLAYVAQANNIENTISQGLADLSEQLKPLQDLTIRRDKLPPESNQRLRRAQLALKRPRWRGSDFDSDSGRRDDRAGSKSS